MRFTWFAIGTFAIGTATVAYLAHHEYQATVNYCKGSPEVAAGGGKFSCLEPYNWPWIDMEILFAIIVELGLVVLLVTGLGVGLRGWRRDRRVATASR
jgi:hypothetical protein